MKKILMLIPMMFLFGCNQDTELKIKNTDVSSIRQGDNIVGNQNHTGVESVGIINKNYNNSNNEKIDKCNAGFADIDRIGNTNYYSYINDYNLYLYQKNDGKCQLVETFTKYYGDNNIVDINNELYFNYSTYESDKEVNRLVKYRDNKSETLYTLKRDPSSINDIMVISDDYLLFKETLYEEDSDSSVAVYKLLDLNTKKTKVLKLDKDNLKIHDVFIKDKTLTILASLDDETYRLQEFDLNFIIKHKKVGDNIKERFLTITPSEYEDLETSLYSSESFLSYNQTENNIIIGGSSTIICSLDYTDCTQLVGSSSPEIISDSYLLYSGEYGEYLYNIKDKTQNHLIDNTANEILYADNETIIFNLYKNNDDIPYGIEYKLKKMN